jgi:hypothetical protein
MAGGATPRLRAALEEFIRSEQGDTGGGMRSAQADGSKQAVDLASKLLDHLGGAQQERQQSTPGQRARSRATAGQAINDAGARARSMLTD